MEGFPFTPDQFHPELVHQILLTDDEDLPNITFKGYVQTTSDRTSMPFAIFAKNHGVKSTANTSVSNSQDFDPAPTNIADQIGNTMRRAFFDRIYEDITKHGNFVPFQNMLKELFTSIRELVPRRKDLHSFLDDELVLQENLKHNYKNTNMTSLFAPVIKAAEALIQLEAPDQNEATSEWLQIATIYLSISSTSTHSSPSSVMTSLDIDGTKFAIISTAYLVHKTNFCQMDIQSVHLRQALVPKLRMNNGAKGILWEQYYFQKDLGTPQIGSSNEVNNIIPHTCAWAQEILSSIPEFGTFSKQQRIHNILQKGIIQSIIFSSSSKPKHLPEILKFDAKAFHRIRRVAQLSVTGSALALHCCMVAGILTISGDGDGLRKTHEILSRDTIQKERMLLTKAMGKGRGQDGNEMTDSLKEAILALSDTLLCYGSSSSTPPLDENQRKLLLQRGEAVLSGKDPVFKLLDKRIRQFFASVIISSPEGTASNTNSNSSVPAAGMRTGYGIQLKSSASHLVQTKNSKTKKIVIQSAIENACMAGFSIYAHDLAQASWNLKQIGDLMIEVHWDLVLEKVLFDLCQDT